MFGDRSDWLSELLTYRDNIKTSINELTDLIKQKEN